MQKKAKWWVDPSVGDLPNLYWNVVTVLEQCGSVVDEWIKPRDEVESTEEAKKSVSGDLFQNPLGVMQIWHAIDWTLSPSVDSDEMLNCLILVIYYDVEYRKITLSDSFFKCPE